jgi:hypothetical protein
MAPTQDDLIKNLLLQPRLLKDFLRAFLPEVFEFANLEGITYLDKEHPRKGSMPSRRGDLLVKVRWQGEEGVFLIHIESQGQAQDVLLQRITEYCMRDSIQYGLPVMPVVLLTYDKPRTRVPGRLKWQFGGLASIQVKCPVLHFQRMNPSGYLSGKNLAALALANVMDLSAEQRVEAIVKALAEAVRQNLRPAEEKALVEFATAVRSLTETQMLQLEEKITTLAKKNKRLARMPTLINPFIELGKLKGREEGLQEGRQEGLQKGREEGRQEGEQAVVLRLLKRRFPKISDKVLTLVKRFDEETLFAFGEALLYMQSEADCLAWVKAKR